MNFPKTHYLNRPPNVINQADVIIGMELSDFWGVVNAYIDNGEHGIGINESKIKPDTKLISINSVDADHQVELPGLPALPERRRVDAGGRRGDAAVADRGGEVRHPQRPQGGDPEARRGDPQGLRGRPRERQTHRRACLGCEPDQHGAPEHGDLESDQGPRLVAGGDHRQCQQLAATGCGRWRSTITGSARSGGYRRRLRRSGLGRRRARQPRSRPRSRSASSPTAT